MLQFIMFCLQAAVIIIFLLTINHFLLLVKLSLLLITVDLNRFVTGAL